MSEYDLRTKKALRQVTLLEYGFGPETMKRRKICPECGRANGAQDTHCTDCGAALPSKTLYDFYLSRHRCAPAAGRGRDEHLRNTAGVRGCGCRRQA